VKEGINILKVNERSITDWNEKDRILDSLQKDVNKISIQEFNIIKAKLADREFEVKKLEEDFA
jgi:hypothetical protein